MRKLTAIAVISVFFTSEVLAQSATDAKPYDVAEAYKIYSLLLPHEESYGFAKDTLMVQENTVAEDLDNQPSWLGVTETYEEAVKLQGNLTTAGWTRVAIFDAARQEVKEKPETAGA